MKCHFCDKEATVHLTEIINNQMVELHLCEEHAAEKGAESGQTFSVSDFLSGFADFFSDTQMMKETAQKTCPTCGMSFEDFSKSGRLGCGNCYESFKASLLPLIKKVQRSTQHVGKTPLLTDKSGKIRVKIQQLQNQLRQAVEREDYEEAAKIRDEIKKRENPSKEKGSQS